MVHLHRYSWLKMKLAIFHLIQSIIHVQNMISILQDLICAIMLTNIDVKMKIFSHSIDQHAIEDVKLSLATRSTTHLLPTYIILSFCNKIHHSIIIYKNKG